MTTPLKFALVPIEPIERPSICDNGDSTRCCFSPSGVKYCCADVEQAERDASPGNDLLERIVRALNLGSSNLRNDGFTAASDQIDAILNELGGGHG